ncbi:hypothetical protein GPECTOR_55g256 [Gonium pectorale]|uniref:Exostosin GT47 domain-containing protein n=1 Tax=Gonium pectorale TaxID=33097 RepID=A0A150G7N1_GONPE|nr:hypothetical protein GPECTOR_55g256 [Gonium pectorale]|eukprot:KXZ45350.1 hypothetical protein GPECTOR_55g256 [Gonium pectorale]
MRFGPVLGSALPPAAMIEHPLMVGWDDPSIVKWDVIMKGDGRKVYNPGRSRLTTNASVLQGHPGGIFDAVMLEHLKTVCDSKDTNKPCKRKVCALARGNWCKDYYNQDPSKGGAKVEWGGINPDHIFGPNGWCNADGNPDTHCGCIMDGWQGAYCDQPIETFCINQCSGRGECQTGFCKCYEGWYGMDCSRQRASAKEKTTGDHEPGGSKPHLTPIVVDPPAAMDRPPHATRRRPLIYVYDTDPLFNTKMMQYRIARTACAYRLFGSSNETIYNNYVYSLESYWIEMLSVSSHRTYDPEEADYFFVPVQLTCYLWPVLGWADHPWFGMPAAHSRAHQGSNMYLQAKQWIQKHYPYWDRRGGRDHVWMILNDEGGCWMPTEIYNTSILLTHWGRMDYQHDLVIPSLKPAGHFMSSPLLGAPPMQRDILLYLRGDTGPWRAHWYSRGIRQRLTKSQAAIPNTWQGLSSAWSRPIMDGVHAVFESILEWDAFSVRIKEEAVNEGLPQFLKSFSPEQVERMQRRLATVWHRFAYAMGPLISGQLVGAYDYNKRVRDVSSRVNGEEADAATAEAAKRLDPEGRGLSSVGQGGKQDGGSKTPGPLGHPFQPYTRFPSRSDAWNTIMAWLHSRIPYTR